jgi:CheY-like chemotaxis protein
LTQHLLAFSRRQPLDPKPLDVNRLVSGMSNLLRRTLGETIAVETVLAGGLWKTHVDANQLEVALLNLAVNARDAMPSGGHLTIETANVFLDEGYAALQSEVLPGQYVVIAVTDTGTGMPRDVLERAFEPFFTTKAVGHGTGLGLSQVYGFVKQSGGHVKIYSESGQGTSVKIYLPRLLVEVADAEPAAQPRVSEAGRHSETILVVEDDESVRAYSTETLAELGYRVLEAAAASEALAIIANEPDLALIFTDVGLAGPMNGRQLAEQARRLRPDVKVLFTTGYARNAIVHDGRLDAGVQLLTKPFTYEALAAKVREVLDCRSVGARILIVEDEFLVRAVAVEALGELGLRVEEAASAREAIDKVRALRGLIDAAIVDIGLPDRRGDELAAELRAMYASLPIILATGYAQGEMADRFREDQLVAFLGKPYDAQQLEAVLGRFGIRRMA